MAKVHVSATLHVPAQAVWNMIGGINELARWHPAVVRSEESREDDATIRRLILMDGGMVTARLERHDEHERSYSYTIIETPLPVAEYRAHLRVRESDDGNSCTVDWSSEFEPTEDAPESEAVRAIRGVYEAGFENLRRLFGS
ncbi:MAG: SRPBCC family protein [Dongiaceae bacterium]